MHESVASILQDNRYKHLGAPVPCDGRGRLAVGALERGESAEL